ncbi:hypothetical protein GCM10022251_48510 [Phytohabitans flavus]|uniref:Uncharacterized protein n=1 Tax=Phytohabitans flavus TaxID=1076124 RepID=A0A6F8XSV1_9ACTN|nr:hypothetical protein Pflav_033060 [Phytohabitans flavus]
MLCAKVEHGEGAPRHLPRCGWLACGTGPGYYVIRRSLAARPALYRRVHETGRRGTSRDVPADPRPAALTKGFGPAVPVWGRPDESCSSHALAHVRTSLAGCCHRAR